jgi:ABC-type Fe3+-hydroxamate transport system substrate-binding protein
MKRILVAAAAALAIAGCMQQIGRRESAASACNVSANDTWRPEGGGEFSIEAASAGPDCERAVATLVIRDAEGRVAWAEAYPTEDIMVLANARDSGAMEVSLAGWINPAANTTMQTSSALPEWPANADSPQNGEFPFYPEAGYDRDSYTTLRTNNLPLYCFVQGMESMACLALGDSGLEKIGVQSFPG